MRRFRLGFHPLRPDGRWYFVGPGGQDPYDSEQGGYNILNTNHYPCETDANKDTAIHEELNDNLGEACDETYRSNMFRIQPCRERIEPLLAAFARSVTCGNMPCLDDAEIFTHLWWMPSHDMKTNGYDLPRNSGDEGGVMVSARCEWGVKVIAGHGGSRDKPRNDQYSSVVQWQVGDGVKRVAKGQLVKSLTWSDI